MRWIVVLFLVLAGCQTTPVILRHPQTGKTVQCGPYWVGAAGDFKMEGIAMRESQCIKDYKEQGYVRQ